VLHAYVHLLSQFPPGASVAPQYSGIPLLSQCAAVPAAVPAAAAAAAAAAVMTPDFHSLIHFPLVHSPEF